MQDDLLPGVAKSRPRWLLACVPLVIVAVVAGCSSESAKAGAKGAFLLRAWQPSRRSLLPATPVTCIGRHKQHGPAVMSRHDHLRHGQPRAQRQSNLEVDTGDVTSDTNQVKSQFSFNF